jgi:hypothetical protein
MTKVCKYPQGQKIGKPNNFKNLSGQEIKGLKKIG